MDCLKECFRSRWLRVVHPKVNFLSSSLLAVWYLTHGPRSVSHQSQQCHPYPVLYLPLPGRLPLWFRAEVSSWHASHVFLMVLLIKLLRLLIKLINSVDFFFRTPEPNSRATSPSYSDYENFPIVPSMETSYLARAGKHEFLNLVPDIEEMRPGSVLTLSAR